MLRGNLTTYTHNFRLNQEPLRKNGSMFSLNSSIQFERKGCVLYVCYPLIHPNLSNHKYYLSDLVHSW